LFGLGRARDGLKVDAGTKRVHALRLAHVPSYARCRSRRLLLIVGL
jgi:hypothetical protein